MFHIFQYIESCDVFIPLNVIITCFEENNVMMSAAWVELRGKVSPPKGVFYTPVCALATIERLQQTNKMNYFLG